MVRAAVTPLAELPTCAEPPLVLDCVRGDRSAWRRLHQRYHPISVAFLRRLGVAEPDLEDATQEVFLEMFRYLPGFRGGSELTTWLYRLCITQARRARRRRRVALALQQLLLMAPAEHLISSPAFSENQARKRIEGALSRLSDTERSVFVLYEMEGLSGKQIAEILGCKEATLWRRLHYARKRFIEVFDPATQLESSTPAGGSTESSWSVATSNEPSPTELSQHDGAGETINGAMNSGAER